MYKHTITGLIVWIYLKQPAGKRLKKKQFELECTTYKQDFNFIFLYLFFSINDYNFKKLMKIIFEEEVINNFISKFDPSTLSLLGGKFRRSEKKDFFLRPLHDVSKRLDYYVRCSAEKRWKCDIQNDGNNSEHIYYLIFFKYLALPDFWTRICG